MRKIMLSATKKIAQKGKPLYFIMKNNDLSRPIADFIYKSYKKLNNEKPSPRERTYANVHSSTSVKEKTILFESYYGQKLACNPLAIFLALIKVKNFDDYKCVWVINKNTIIPDYIKKFKNVSFVIHQSNEYLEALCTSQFLINNNTFPPYFSPKVEQVYINTYHGIPIKKMGRDINDTLVSIANTQRNFLISTHLLSNSAYTDEHLYGKYGVNGLLQNLSSVPASHELTSLQITVGSTYMIDSR